MCDPTSPNFSTLIAKFLRTVVELNKDLESTKINLVENHLFNPFVAYQYFDRFGQGYATKADIRAHFDDALVRARELLAAPAPLNPPAK